MWCFKDERKIIESLFLSDKLAWTYFSGETQI